MGSGELRATADFALSAKSFFPGWPRPAKQVVFAAVDGYADAGTTCGRVSMTMASRLPGSVCVIEAERNDPSLEYVLKNGHAHTNVLPGKIARLAHRIQENLWLLRADEFFEGAIPSLAGLRSRLSELRREFDYTVIHAPAVGACSETGLLGQIADGLILVLDERKTRRATAREAKQVLLDTSVRLLGVVINDRQFPIPEPIYRKL
jgi:succinoglycan biosynthesis transport protein ExoP